MSILAAAVLNRVFCCPWYIHDMSYCLDKSAHRLQSSLKNLWTWLSNKLLDLMPAVQQALHSGRKVTANGRIKRDGTSACYALGLKPSTEELYEMFQKVPWGNAALRTYGLMIAELDAAKESFNVNGNGIQEKN